MTGSTDEGRLPMADRPVAEMPGHWVLARLGKKVLRPGGAALTRTMLAAAQIPGSRVVELAPGLGRTAGEIVALKPAHYRGVERDEAAASFVRAVIGDAGECVVGDAAATGLPEGCADVVVAEAMLTMQSARGKAAIVKEAARLLRPGGRYAIHELTVVDGSDAQRDLARSIKVNAQPLSPQQWCSLLEDAGFDIVATHEAPMRLLSLGRLVADEGPAGATRFLLNLLRDREARARVLAMRAVFHRHRRELRGIAIVGRRVTAEQPE